MKRKLDNKEKELNQKAIDRLKKENEQAQFLLEIEQLRFKKGHRLQYEAQLEQSQLKINQLTSQIGGNEITIRELEKQNKEGVEPKKPIGV